MHLYIDMNRLTPFKQTKEVILPLKTKLFELNDSTHEENFVIAFLFS